MNNSNLVSSVMTDIDNIPVVTNKALLKDGLDKMRDKGLGIVCVVSPDGQLEGIFTDGDLRRLILNVHKPLSAFFVDDILDHAKKNPTVINENSTLEMAIEIMAKKRIWDLPVITNAGRCIGLFHLHDGLEKLVTSKI